MPECFSRASILYLPDAGGDSRYPARKQRDAENAKHAGMTVVLLHFA